MRCANQLYFVMMTILVNYPVENSAMLTKFKMSGLLHNTSYPTTIIIGKFLSIMEGKTPVYLRVLHHQRFEDLVDGFLMDRIVSDGVMSFQVTEEETIIQHLVSPASGRIFLFLFSPPTWIPQLFYKIQQERIASHFVKWIIVLEKESELDEILTGLDGKIDEGAQVILLIRVSVNVCKFYSSHLDFDGTIRLFDKGTWDLTENRSKILLPGILMPDQVDQYSNFNGRKLTVGANNNLPFTMKRRDSDEGEELPQSGIDFSMIDTLKKELNFTYRLVSPPDGQWGGPLPNGTVTGLIGLVYRKEANFACSATAIIGPREEVVDFTYPYYIDSLSLVSRAPQQNNRAFAVFMPFTFQVWLCLIAITLGIGPCLKLFSEIEERISSNEILFKSKGLEQFSFNAFRNIVLQGNMMETKVMPLRITFAFWFIFCLLISALYSGTLTAVLAIPSYEKPIDSLFDLPRAIREGFTVGTVKQTMIEYLLKDATEGIYKQTWDLLTLKDSSETLVPNPVIGFNKILPDKFIMIAPTAVSVVASAVRGRENYHLGRQTFYPIIYGIACPTGSPIKDKFSQLQARMVESGLVYKWEDDVFYKVLKRTGHGKSSTPPAISLVHLQAAFFLLALGTTSAFIVLLAERIHNYMGGKRTSSIGGK